MTSDLKTTTTEILKKLAEDRQVCGKAKEMLMFYAEVLESDGQKDIYDFALDFAEAPPTYWKILEQWDGNDPEIGLARFDSIMDAMKARIVECNLETLTNEAVRMYWNQLSQTIDQGLPTEG